MSDVLVDGCLQFRHAGEHAAAQSLGREKQYVGSCWSLVEITCCWALPLEAGAVHTRSTDSLPRVPDTPVGAPGTVRGVTAADGVDAAEAPIGFVALTVKVYPVPLLSPDTVHEVVGAVAVHVLPPGLVVTVYPVTADSPFGVGAVQDTSTSAFPGVPVTEVGALGTASGVTADEAGE